MKRLSIAAAILLVLSACAVPHERDDLALGKAAARTTEVDQVFERDLDRLPVLQLVVAHLRGSGMGQAGRERQHGEHGAGCGLQQTPHARV